MNENERNKISAAGASESAFLSQAIEEAAT
jgi:hypothetical protein